MILPVSTSRLLLRSPVFISSSAYIIEIRRNLQCSPVLSLCSGYKVSFLLSCYSDTSGKCCYEQIYLQNNLLCMLSSIEYACCLTCSVNTVTQLSLLCVIVGKRGLFEVVSLNVNVLQHFLMIKLIFLPLFS